MPPVALSKFNANAAPKSRARTLDLRAFEISNNGHSIVHDNLASDLSPQAKYGARYIDNTIYGWGDINSGGGIASGFRVLSVTHLGAGTYGIILNNSVNLTNASVTVTIRNNDTTNSNWMAHPNWQLKAGTPLDNACGHAEATEIGIFNQANGFIIHTYYVASCDPQDLPFFFKVCGR